MSDLYCLDSSVLIEQWNKYYSPVLCPEYWNILDSLARDGVAFCTHDVKREIEKVDDDLSKWVKSHPHIIRDVDEKVQKNLRTILQEFPRLVDTKKDRSMADPWIIAHAMAAEAIVVTKELPAGPNAKPGIVKIPDVCDHFGVRWMNDFDFLKKVGVAFSAKR